MQTFPFFYRDLSAVTCLFSNLSTSRRNRVSVVDECDCGESAGKDIFRD